jgi:ubiquitin
MKDTVTAGSWNWGHDINYQQQVPQYGQQFQQNTQQYSAAYRYSCEILAMSDELARV